MRTNEPYNRFLDALADGGLDAGVACILKQVGPDVTGFVDFIVTAKRPLRIECAPYQHDETHEPYIVLIIDDDEDLTLAMPIVVAAKVSVLLQLIATKAESYHCFNRAKAYRILGNRIVKTIVKIMPEEMKAEMAKIKAIFPPVTRH